MKTLKIISLLALLSNLPFLNIANAFVLSGNTDIKSDGRFTGGDLYESINLYGDITVTCREGNRRETRRIYCRGNILNPGEFTYFEGPEGIDADEVFLEGLHEDGSIRQKNESYDASIRRSDDINLWIRTLFQRPLLEFGRNTINWDMKKNNQSVAQGSFEVEVISGPDRQCRHRWYNSNNMSDCRGGGIVCDRHFRLENYCQ